MIGFQLQKLRVTGAQSNMIYTTPKPMSKLFILVDKILKVYYSNREYFYDLINNILLTTGGGFKPCYKIWVYGKGCINFKIILYGGGKK